MTTTPTTLGTCEIWRHTHTNCGVCFCVCVSATKRTRSALTFRAIHTAFDGGESRKHQRHQHRAVGRAEAEQARVAYRAKVMEGPSEWAGKKRVGTLCWPLILVWAASAFARIMSPFLRSGLLPVSSLVVLLRYKLRCLVWSGLVWRAAVAVVLVLARFFYVAAVYSLCFVRPHQKIYRLSEHTISYCKWNDIVYQRLTVHEKK